jgi:hypothetical protein
MSKNNVVSIKAHPQYRDVAALRRYLAEGQDDFGTPVHISHILDLKAPELQEQLSELNAWAEALQGLTPISISAPTDEPAIQMDFSHYTDLNLSHGPNVGKSIPMGPLLDGLMKGGFRRGEFALIAAMPSPRHNHIALDNRYMVKESTDANPST